MNWLERLMQDPGSFDFHVALRRFETARADQPRLGQADRPAAEALRLGQAPSTSFNAAELGAVAFDAGSAPRLSVNFFGLWGPHGPLPGHMTEYAHERLRHAGDPSLVRFADVFHHRMLLLFYRAWATAQAAVSADRPQSDAFARYLAALAGLGLDGARGGDAERTALHYAGWFSSGGRSADGLRSIIEDYLGVHTEIEEFVGDWLDVSEDARWQLGRAPETGAFGRAMIGQRVWSVTHKFRIVLGPMPSGDLESMLPGEDGLEVLASLVDLYVNNEWAWEVRLVLAPLQPTSFALGRGARLGWTTHLGAGARPEFDLVVDPATRQTRRIRTRTRPVGRSSERT